MNTFVYLFCMGKWNKYLCIRNYLKQENILGYNGKINAVHGKPSLKAGTTFLLFGFGNKIDHDHKVYVVKIRVERWALMCTKFPIISRVLRCCILFLRQPKFPWNLFWTDWEGTKITGVLLHISPEQETITSHGPTSRIVTRRKFNFPIGTTLSQ